MKDKYGLNSVKFGTNRPVCSRATAKIVLPSLRTDRCEGETRRQCWVSFIAEKICITLVKMWRKSGNWFKRYSKKSIDTVDLGSGQITVKEGRYGLARVRELVTVLSN